MQTDFIPNLFNYIAVSQGNLSFPAAPFFMYKLLLNEDDIDRKEDIVDWERSIYFNMSISDFNILDWRYDTGAAETGIMLVESIQNFKTYFS